MKKKIREGTEKLSKCDQKTGKYTTQKNTEDSEHLI